MPRALRYEPGQLQKIIYRRRVGNEWKSESGILPGMSKPGPKPKPPRWQFTARVPVEHRPRLEQAASAAGLPVCDYVALVLANAHGWDEPTYISAPEELPLERSA